MSYIVILLHYLSILDVSKLQNIWLKSIWNILMPYAAQPSGVKAILWSNTELNLIAVQILYQNRSRVYISNTTMTNTYTKFNFLSILVIDSRAWEKIISNHYVTKIILKFINLIISSQSMQIKK